MNIYRNDISDILKELPELEKLNLTKPCDLFVCTLGFEDRTHQIISKLAQSGLTENAVLLLIKYPTNASDNEINMPFFEKASRNFKGYQEIIYSRHDFSPKMRSILKNLLSNNATNVLFDVSTCSSYVFYPVIKELIDSNIDLSILYAEAETYFPTKDEWEEVARKADSDAAMFSQEFENAGFLSVGVEDVYPCTLFSEMNPGNLATILVAIPNFSAIRMNAIISRDRELNKTAFERTYWLIGEPPGSINKWRLDAVKKTNNLDNIRPSHMMDVSTLNYKDMLKSLEDIWIENRHTHHIIIGSLGSKMQHLGTFLFLCLHQDTGLWLSEPTEFKARRFSQGFGNTWQIKLGSTIRLKQMLKEYMMFKWEF